MRDRRNTGSSFCSLSSSSSAASCSSLPLYLQIDEKLHGGPSTISSILPPAQYAKRRRLGLSKMAFRILVASCSLLLIWRCIFYSFIPLQFSFQPIAQDELEVVSSDTLPDYPTALMVHDRAGHLKWTVAIPHNASFPLQSEQYNAICTQGSALQKGILDGSPLQQLSPFSSRGRDRTFLDVMDAENAGALPHSSNTPDTTTCASTLTFVFEPSDRGFGSTLLLLWLSYGLAIKEGRAFFIDDSRWAYGKYTTYFKPIPTAGCTRPLAHQILPCPSQARHLLVSSSTSPWIFDAKFSLKHFNTRRFGMERQRSIYDLLRRGYEDLFHLADQDSNAAIARIREIRAEAQKHAGSVVGIHIRRGDLHPFEYQFNHDYLPTERYSTAGRKLLDHLRKQRGHDDNALAKSEFLKSPLLLSSDDPGLIESSDLALHAEPYHVSRVQDRIVLATKKALDRASPMRSIRRQKTAFFKHVDENAGWDGGFFPALFYAIGQSERTNTIGSSDVVSESAMHVREMVGRAYVLDLAVLGQSSDGIVCAVSSATCRALAVMLGWDAVKHGRWVNVDDGRTWSLTGMPGVMGSVFT